MKYLNIFLFLIITFQLYPNEIKVDTIKQTELEELIRTREGKYLLINLWATWCIPCREEFPDLIKLAGEYNNKLDIVGLSVDFIEDLDTQVLPFLNKMEVNFPVFISGFKKDEELIKFFHNNWNGALPASFLYNKSGNQIFFFEGKQSIESFISKIDKLE